MTSKFMQVEEALRKITIAKLDKLRRDSASDIQYREELKEPQEFLTAMRISEGKKAIKFLEDNNEDFDGLFNLEIRVNGIQVKFFDKNNDVREVIITWEELE